MIKILSRYLYFRANITLFSFSRDKITKVSLFEAVCGVQSKGVVEMVVKRGGGGGGWGGVGGGDASGWTEMHQAAYFGKYSTIQLLKNEGLLLFLLDVVMGGVSVYFIHDYFHPPFFLLSFPPFSFPLGGSVDIETYFSHTPLHLAASSRKKCSGVVDLLICLGCDPRLVDFEGKTALHLACENNNFLNIGKNNFFFFFFFFFFAHIFFFKKLQILLFKWLIFSTKQLQNVLK